MTEDKLTPPLSSKGGPDCSKDKPSPWFSWGHETPFWPLRHVGLHKIDGKIDLLVPNKVSQEEIFFLLPLGYPTLNCGSHLAIRLGDEANTERA